MEEGNTLKYESSCHVDLHYGIVYCNGWELTKSLLLDCQTKKDYLIKESQRTLEGYLYEHISIYIKRIKKWKTMGFSIGPLPLELDQNVLLLTRQWTMLVPMLVHRTFVQLKRTHCQIIV